MKKIALHPYLLITLCTFSLLTLSIMLLTNSSANNVIILHDNQSKPTSTSSVITDDGKININNASAEDLTQIPGIGEVLSQRIIQYRDTNGNFKNINDLLHVKGIGQKTIQKIEHYISVGE